MLANPAGARLKSAHTLAMTKHYWLVKQEPESYSWETFAREGRTSWDGVRNYQARNNLRLMAPGDLVLFYASGGPKEVVGVAKVSRAPYPDPTAEEPAWVSVELQAQRALRSPSPFPASNPHPVFRGCRSCATPAFRSCLLPARNLTGFWRLKARSQISGFWYCLLGLGERAFGALRFEVCDPALKLGVEKG